jgi:hypothetical protein
MRAKARATAGSPGRWTPASPLSSGPGASWSRKGSRRCWPANTTRTPPGGGFSTARRKQKLIALTLSPAPEGFARWSLRLLEEKVVELHIVERASDSTIGRALKKHSPAPSPTAVGYAAEGQQRVRSGDGIELADVHFANAKTIALVQDNLNIHSKASLYERG